MSDADPYCTYCTTGEHFSAEESRCAQCGIHYGGMDPLDLPLKICGFQVYEAAKSIRDRDLQAVPEMDVAPLSVYIDATHSWLRGAAEIGLAVLLRTEDAPSVDAWHFRDYLHHAVNATAEKTEVTP